MKITDQRFELWITIAAFPKQFETSAKSGHFFIGEIFEVAGSLRRSSDYRRGLLLWVSNSVCSSCVRDSQMRAQISSFSSSLIPCLKPRALKYSSWISGEAASRQAATGMSPLQCCHAPSSSREASLGAGALNAQTSTSSPLNSVIVIRSLPPRPLGMSIKKIRDETLPAESQGRQLPGCRFSGAWHILLTRFRGVEGLTGVFEPVEKILAGGKPKGTDGHPQICTADDLLEFLRDRFQSDPIIAAFQGA